MANLVIKRISEYSYKLRDYNIYLDGNLIDVIEDGQTKEYTVNPGKHSHVRRSLRLRRCGKQSPTAKNAAKQFEELAE